MLPLYQALTSVTIGNGKGTTFWLDAWHLDDSMADKFPALFIHCANKTASVQQVFHAGIDDNSFWVPRFTLPAGAELAELKIIMQATTLSPETDCRRGPLCLPNGKFDSGSLYRLLKSKEGTEHPAAKFVWSSRAPPRVQFFIWLLMHGRI
jgi:hypothetical protein